MTDLYRDLEKTLGPERTLRNAPLSEHTTIRIGGPADMICLPRTDEQVIQILRVTHDRGIPWMPLGNGSNILFPDEGFRGVIIKIRGNSPEPGTLWALENQDDRVIACAGVGLARLAWFSASIGLSGVEFGTGIPGVVGGSVRGNAGAHGQAMGDRIQSIDGVSSPGEPVRLTGAQAGFSYRHTALGSDFIITRVVFALTPDRPQDIRERIASFSEYRKSTQPTAEQSAGCMFRNPTNDSAGRLIEAAGCKGLQIGGMAVSDRHANFFVNKGQATRSDTLRLIETVRERVRGTTGVELELEVHLMNPEGA